eukprot:GHRR01003536.1.p1 GENE.GHRR01003536.1~~GHRR01003536.1.p1  ORF type:complete len:405 (+),score=83.80 GHRR01003536.1:328-1542(+)
MAGEGAHIPFSSKTTSNASLTSSGGNSDPLSSEENDVPERWQASDSTIDDQEGGLPGAYKQDVVPSATDVIGMGGGDQDVAPSGRDQELNHQGDQTIAQQKLQVSDYSTGRDQSVANAPAPAAATEVAAAPASDAASEGDIRVPIGQRVWCDPGVNLNSRQNPFTEGFALLTMALYLGWIHVLILLTVASLLSRTALIVLIGIWATVLLPAEPLMWGRFLSNPVWKAWRRYFRFSIVFDANFPLAHKKYVIAEYPHGVFPLSQLIAVSLTDTVWPGHHTYSLGADSLFHVPMWRHVMSWIGARPATATNFKQLLKKGSVGLVPGGIAEMFMVEKDREVIKLLDRKGFVRIAIEEGADLLPCYHFGNSQLFQWKPKSWEKLARRHRVALGFMFGRWGLPFALPWR